MYVVVLKCSLLAQALWVRGQTEYIHVLSVRNVMPVRQKSTTLQWEILPEAVHWVKSGLSIVFSWTKIAPFVAPLWFLFHMFGGDIKRDTFSRKVNELII